MKTNLFLFIFGLLTLSFYPESVHAQWMRVLETGIGINRLYSPDEESGIVYASIVDGIYRSTNKGSSWSLRGLSGSNVSDVIKVDTILFASVQNQPSAPLGVHKSNDDGDSWDMINSGLGSTPFIHSLASFNSSIFAGKRLSGFFKTINEDFDWEPENTGLPPTSLPTAYQLVVSGNRLLAATDDGFLVYVNSSWSISNAGLPSTTVRGIAVASSTGDTIFIGTDDGVYRSIDGGDNWSLRNNGIPANAEVLSILSIDNGKTLLAGVAPSGVYRSTNDGLDWTAFNEGLPSGTITTTAISICDTFLLIGITSTNSNNRGIWRRPLSQVIVSVDQSLGNIPEKFTLAQNYPNPFNPSTTIKFQIPATSFVELKVFDLLGREIATLVNEEKSPGSYETTFDSKGLSSGVYFYRIKAGEFVQTKKLILQK